MGWSKQHRAFEPIDYSRRRIFQERKCLQSARLLNSYKSFTNIRFKGTDTSLSGIRGAQAWSYRGMFSYDASLKAAKSFPRRPFKLYMRNNGGFWQIFYFVLPAWMAMMNSTEGWFSRKHHGDHLSDLLVHNLRISHSSLFLLSSASTHFRYHCITAPIVAKD